MRQDAGDPETAGGVAAPGIAGAAGTGPADLVEQVVATVAQHAIGKAIAVAAAIVARACIGRAAGRGIVGLADWEG